MKMILDKFCATKPVPKARARVSNGKARTPPRTLVAEKKLAALLMGEITGEPLGASTAITLELEYWLPIPKWDRQKEKKQEALSRPWAHTEKPDVDNLAKLTMDVLKRMGLYEDDGQVCRLTTCKRYAVSGEEPGTRIRAWLVTSENEF